jgi:hypothetical protein
MVNYSTEHEPLLNVPCNLLVEAVVGRIHTVVEVVHNHRHIVVGRRRVAGSSLLCWVCREQDYLNL